MNATPYPIRLGLILILSVACFPAWAKITPNETRIDSVSYDLASHTLAIDGARFIDPGLNAAPYVEFGGSALVVTSFSANSIIATLPSGLGDGEYQIYVERTVAASQTPHTRTNPSLHTDYSLSVITVPVIPPSSVNYLFTGSLGFTLNAGQCGASSLSISGLHVGDTAILALDYATFPTSVWIVPGVVKAVNVLPVAVCNNSASSVSTGSQPVSVWRVHGPN
jgi:hypothetical protein